MLDLLYNRIKALMFKYKNQTSNESPVNWLVHLITAATILLATTSAISLYFILDNILNMICWQALLVSLILFFVINLIVFLISKSKIRQTKQLLDNKAVKTVFNNESKSQNLAADSDCAGQNYNARIESERIESAIQSTLDDLPVGVIQLDDKLNVISNNRSAPICIDSNGKQPQLDWSGSPISLSEWAKKVGANDIAATKIWPRVQNVPSGSLEDRHIYDVVAKYKRRNADNGNITLVTLDRTDSYIESDSSIDFITLAAHELRGPITILRGYTSILLDDYANTFSDDQRQILNQIQVSSNRLSSYINNILNANRYDKKQYKFTLNSVNLIDVVNQVKLDLELRAATFGSNIEWSIPNNLPNAYCDPSAIEQVLVNLVDNAIKYSHNNSIINVNFEIDPNNSNYIIISVVDHGVGITRSALPNLFSKFYRSERTGNAVGGSGLGLYICRIITEGHGGNISVQSTPGKGSTFYFTIPIYNEDNVIKLDNRPSAQINNHGLIR